MSVTMPNLRKLIDDMNEKDWIITAFDFHYKQHDYIVICENISSHAKKKKESSKNFYFIAQLTFMDSKDESRTLIVLANSSYFSVNPKDFRTFFNIDYSENLGNIFQQFYDRFNNDIPYKMPEKLNNQKLHACIKTLDSKTKENKGTICFNIIRNGKLNQKQKHRTICNSEKTKLLYPDLYEKFKNDPTISFCYTDDITKKKSSFELIQKFINNDR